MNRSPQKNFRIRKRAIWRNCNLKTLSFQLIASLCHVKKHDFYFHPQKPSSFQINGKGSQTPLVAQLNGKNSGSDIRDYAKDGKKITTAISCDQRLKMSFFKLYKRIVQKYTVPFYCGGLAFKTFVIAIKCEMNFLLSSLKSQ